MQLIPQLLYPVYERRLAAQLRDKARPNHVAVMCDGNRRWAREAGFEDVSHGHRVGARRIANLVQWCVDANIPVVTFYLLSTENLGRDSSEVELLYQIIGDVVAELSAPELNAKVQAVGHLELLPAEFRKRMAEETAKTADHDGVIVNIAVGYGGRQEIVDAVQAVVSDKIEEGVAAGDLASAITSDEISSHLYTKGQPDPDLVIRTSGEQRLSGFLLWQSAYSEIWFTDTYWPAFRRVDFLRALRDYSQRNRRFGK
ncbi:isoprenyl transferase [Corynebacterium ulceribovis]|uniref:isoprenyl transferase n=1 Tax=Corynebacterium ulceribovis TaxID=487732 RepID=UPI000475A879|nr:isoprenyl transferase [Corynebacterium ulceribovis]